MDRGARRSTVHGVAKSQTRLSDYRTHYLRAGGLDDTMSPSLFHCGDFLVPPVVKSFL